MPHDILKNDDTDEKMPGDDKRLRQTLDHMLEGIQIIGFDWRYIYVNDAMAKHGKYPKEEFYGCTVMEKYPGIEQTEIYKVYQRCFNERIPIHMENRFVFPDGSVGWFELSFQPVPEGIFILSIDITERKKSEESIKQLNEELEQKVKDRTAQLEQNITQLKESEEKFQKAFQASAAAISITRLSDSVYMDVNEAFVKLTGFSYEELIGRTSVQAGFVVDMEKREEVLQQVRDHGSAKNFELTIRNKAGVMLNILSSVETIILNGGKYAINIIYDITERKKGEEQLIAANKELEAFSYTVSHDLKAPLRVVGGYSAILAEEYNMLLDDEGKRMLKVIQNKAQKMGQLIDDLLAFSKLGKTQVQKTMLDMNLLTKEIISEITRTTSINAEIIVGELPAVRGNRPLIKQVMINLIGNAIKYSSKKTTPVIEITSGEKNGELVFSVKDNGAGFDMKYIDRLFGVFERLHAASEFDGTGVGLATVKRIITNHGGSVWAEATPDVGAVFSFSLPK